MYKLFYACGIGGKIKEIPEDFFVEEINEQPGKGAEFTVATLVKKNWNTIDALRAVAKCLNIDQKRIGYSGIKDKKAVTSQRISIKGVAPALVSNLKINNIELKDISLSSDKVYPGSHKGNRFTVIIRGADAQKQKIIDFISESSKKGIANYFGVQRFSRLNDAIGEHIVKGDFEQAVKLMLSAYLDNDKKKLLEKKWADFRAISDFYPENLKQEKNILNALLKNPKDFSAGLRALNKKILKLLINSFQSRIFNEALQLFLSKNYVQSEIEIPGFGSEITTDEVKQAMKKYGVTADSFIITKMQDLSQEGSRRNTLFFPKNFKLLEFNNSFLKLAFELEKGSYATVLLDELMKND